MAPWSPIWGVGNAHSTAGEVMASSFPEDPIRAHRNGVRTGFAFGGNSDCGGDWALNVAKSAVLAIFSLTWSSP